MATNKLIIIGNGFDLAHGLKTSYSNFLIWYLNKAINNLIKNGSHDDELITLKRKYSHKFNEDVIIKSVNDFIDFFQYHETNYSKSKTSSFFNNITKAHRNYNWVDLESEYYELIKSIYIKFEKNNYKKDPIILSELKLLNNSLERIKIELQVYLKEINSNNKALNSEIEKIFSTNLNKYTENKSGTTNILFLNFNYTSTVEMYIPLLKNKLAEINHIHGKLDTIGNEIIFGYGDENDKYYSKIEELNINDFLNHFKSFGYFKNNNYRDLLKYLQNETYEVSIMGHSCGLSDRVMLSTIFEHKNCESIQIYYYKRSDSENNFNHLTQEISRHFKDKAKMREKIISFEESFPLVAKHT